MKKKNESKEIAGITIKELGIYGLEFLILLLLALFGKISGII